jgi:hypothetical protein
MSKTAFKIGESQEVFGTQGLDNFGSEESETLTNFDMVSDAQF